MNSTQRFVLEQSSRDMHTTHARLALLGRATGLSGLEAAADKLPLLHGIAHRDIVKSYLGSLALGKSDFEPVSNMHDDSFIRQRLDITRVPSAVRLRLAQHAEALLGPVDVAVVEFVQAAEVPITILRMGLMTRPECHLTPSAISNKGKGKHLTLTDPEPWTPR